ncbi:PorT family protein [Puteibacter caeruleilacunae]|nr:PorT family protein [Puteibacter caeruleilacunae]
MKHILTTTLVLMIALSSWAQHRDVKLSFVASPQLSWMSSDDKLVSEAGSELGFGFGVSADIFFNNSDRYAFTTGVILNKNGGRLRYNPEGTYSFSGEELPTGTKIDYNLSFIEIPFALKLKTAQFRRNSYWGQFGLTNLINVSAKAKTSDGSFDDNGISDEIKLYNVGLNIGAGFEYDLGGNNAVRVGLIYTKGLTDITDNSQIDDKATLSGLKLELGIVF